ncbi:MAG: MATE family efflux transporter, partial [Myxococcales bacterium]|nr:MATE family efflux transporter [Myxococcales bacterium]
MNPPFRQSLLWKYKPVPELVRLAWPIAVSMLSYSIMTLVDTLFVGRLGASALAAVGIGGVTSFTLICFGFGALRSAKVVVSQAVGAGRRDDVRAVVSAAVVLALGLGAIAVLGGRLLVRVLPDLVQQGHAGALAADYLWVRNLGAPVALVSIALKESRYGLGDTRSPMVATLAANVTNVALDAAFIWGLGLGVRGAAWATVAGYVVEAGLMLFITLRTTDGIAPVRLREVSRLLSLGLPMGLQFVLEVGSFTVLV